MARKVTVQMVDDFDGKSVADETVTFSLDGQSYEIDLSLLNAGQLRGVFEQWTSHARKVGRVGKQPKATRTPAHPGVETQAVRNWARENGYTVSSRGRIQEDVVKAYRAANN